MPNTTMSMTPIDYSPVFRIGAGVDGLGSRNIVSIISQIDRRNSVRPGKPARQNRAGARNLIMAAMVSNTMHMTEALGTIRLTASPNPGDLMRPGPMQSQTSIEPPAPHPIRRRPQG